MNQVKCFFLEPTNRVRRSLRRFVWWDSDNPASVCSVNGHHDASVLMDEIEVLDEKDRINADFWPHVDPRWPKACACGYEFADGDEWQLSGNSLYLRSDTGELTTLRDAPPGAMWDANWMHDMVGWCGPDGRSLVVKLPNGHEWHIDGKARNCTMPHDDVHKCWVRKGEPPNLTVGKDGNTCAAGGGSILSGDYHGFLREGFLVPA